MNWGRKKPSSSSSSSSSRLSSLSQVFPISWFSKFKQMGTKAEPKPAKTKQKNKHRSSVSLSMPPSSMKDTRIQDGDRRMCRRTASDMNCDDTFWNLSFRKENASFEEGKKDRGVLRSVWYNSDDEVEIRRMSAKEEPEKFSEVGISSRNVTWKGKEDREKTDLETPRRMKMNLKDKKVKDRKSRTTVGKAEQEHSFDLQPVKPIQTTRTSQVDEGFVEPNSKNPNQVPSKEIDSERKSMKDSKMKELLSKSEEQRKSLSTNREVEQRRRRRTKPGYKVRVYSPRLASKMEICNARAIEDMKKKKARMMKMKKERTVESTTGLESFAVVKCSFNPQKDFKDSMMEMIEERRIREPEELENLLTCYLSLNSDEYHDVIIKVFKQVWFDLNQFCFDPELQKDHCNYDPEPVLHMNFVIPILRIQHGYFPPIEESMYQRLLLGKDGFPIQVYIVCNFM